MLVLTDLRARNFVHPKTSLRARCVHARHRARNLSSPAVRQNYQTTRSRYKKQLDRKKTYFLWKALSFRNPKEVWETVHGILDPPKKCINQNPEILSQHFTELASKLINKENVAFDQT